jgi:DNA-binding IscR family transcriptional regulator
MVAQHEVAVHGHNDLGIRALVGVGGRHIVLFERFAVSWTIAGLPLTRQKELLGRYRLADDETRRWVRASLDEHIARLRSGPAKVKYADSVLALFLELKRHGLLQSKKGRGGGYFLSRKPADITVGQVIRVLDGPLALIPCVSQTAYMKCEECLDEQTCGVRLAMKDGTFKGFLWHQGESDVAMAADEKKPAAPAQPTAEQQQAMMQATMPGEHHAHRFGCP